CANAPNPGSESPTATASAANGKGRVVLQTRYAFQPDGTIVLFGPAPIVETDGTGAEVVVPADFNRASFPGGANISLSPAVRLIGRGSDQSTRIQPLPFDVDLKLPTPPAPKTVACTQSFAPFEVAKDTFRPDSDLFNQVRDWWVGLDPMVRKAVEEGNLVLRIAGRASATGTDQFNLDLSDKRAKRVGRMIEGLAGSDARLRIFFTCQMLAPPG